jgi:hypothetical protein
MEEQWGDIRDWDDWKERQAALIAQDIKHRNGGHFPVTHDDWVQAAAHYDLILYFVDNPISPPASRHDNTIVVRQSVKPGVLLRRICHEIAEAIAAREVGLRQFAHDGGSDAYHAIARLVEQEAVQFIRHEKQTATKKKQEMERRVCLLQEQIRHETERLQAIDAQLPCDVSGLF